MLFLLSVVALGVIGTLGWGIYQRIAASRLDAIANKRRATSRIVSSGEFVDGSRHLKVAIALTSTDLFYENADLKAYIDLRLVQEVEYDSCLATGREAVGGKVLRIRCYSQLFEFILPNEVVPKWHLLLPQRRPVDLPAATAPEATAPEVTAPAATAPVAVAI
ncbi:MAG TPA: hypothetical protein VF381_02135 [Thermoanaerobaculia bacterium]